VIIVSPNRCCLGGYLKVEVLNFIDLKYFHISESDWYVLAQDGVSCVFHPLHYQNQCSSSYFVNNVIDILEDLRTRLCTDVIVSGHDVQQGALIVR